MARSLPEPNEYREPAATHNSRETAMFHSWQKNGGLVPVMVNGRAAVENAQGACVASPWLFYAIYNK
jgi:hypothetical protein